MCGLAEVFGARDTANVLIRLDISCLLYRFNADCIILIRNISTWKDVMRPLITAT